MTKSILIFLSLCSCLLVEPVLRISKVVAEKGEGVEQVAYAYVDGDGVEDFSDKQKAELIARLNGKPVPKE